MHSPDNFLMLGHPQYCQARVISTVSGAFNLLLEYAALQHIRCLYVPLITHALPRWCRIFH